MANEVWTKCKICVWNPTCHQDAKDPDCYPYGGGCDEFTTQAQLEKSCEHCSTPNHCQGCPAERG